MRAARVLPLGFVLLVCAVGGACTTSAELPWINGGGSPTPSPSPTNTGTPTPVPQDLIVAAGATITDLNPCLVITSTDIGNKTLTVSGNGGSFPDGARLLIMQVTDNFREASEGGDVMIGDTDAGTVQLATIVSSAASSIVILDTPLTNFRSNVSGAAAQACRVPTFENVNVATGGSVRAPSWDGSTGGVIAFEASSTVIINGNLDARGRGLRGGDRSALGLYPSDSLSGTANLDCTHGGHRGEGAAGLSGVPATGVDCGRGYFTTGGGGGNYGNGGGGGGGNAGRGGTGADSAYPIATVSPPQSGGMFGAMQPPVGGDFPFGGGGGGGQQDEGFGGHGGAGGGLIALYLSGTATFSGSGILSAAGNNGDCSPRDPTVPLGVPAPCPPAPPVNPTDGAGGGGAGGSIFIQGATLNFSGTISVRGGDGGGAIEDIMTTTPYGSGGGGGGGRIHYTGLGAINDLAGGMAGMGMGLANPGNPGLMIP